MVTRGAFTLHRSPIPQEGLGPSIGLAAGGVSSLLYARVYISGILTLDVELTLDLQFERKCGILEFISCRVHCKSAMYSPACTDRSDKGRTLKTKSIRTPMSTGCRSYLRLELGGKYAGLITNIVEQMTPLSLFLRALSTEVSDR